MKISSHLFLIAAAKKASKKKVPAGTIALRTANVQCGGFFTNEAEATIQSPGYPGAYSNNLRCFWTFENECATGFTITPISFDLEYQQECHYDKLTFNIVGQEETKVFCGASDDSSTNDEFLFGNDTSDDDSSSEYYSSYYDYDENGDIETGGLDLPFTIEGKQLQMVFSTDGSVLAGGFKVQIKANIKKGCVPGVTRPDSSCLYYTSDLTDQTVVIAYYRTTPDFDVAVPFSEYSSFTFASSDNFVHCITTCIETAGCFKMLYKGDNQDCELRGNELTPVERNQYPLVTLAINGKKCDEDDRVWVDGRTTTRVFCLFSVPGAADDYLDYLNRKNPGMLEWVSTDSETMIDQIVTTKKWSFSVAEDRHSEHGTWYTFHSITYFRQFLNDDGRKRREADSDALFQSLAQEAASEFVNDLDIGDTGATVLETEDPVIEVEILEEVAQPQDVEFAAAFDAVEEIIFDAVMALPKWKNVKMLEWVRKRFGWFTDFSDAPCANYAGQGEGAGVDYVQPTVDAADPCSTIVSFHSALLGYFDDFVCLDRSDENPYGKRKMETRTKPLLGRTRIHYNRFLKKLSCEQRI